MSTGKIFAYLDYRTFLQDWFDRKKRADPTYSYASFALAGGCSKAALANVLTGSRTPRAATLDAFAQAIDLNPRERNFLGLLVEYDCATDMTTRRAVRDRIFAVEGYGHIRTLENEPNDDLFRFVEHWYIPVIGELARLPGFRDDPEWVVSRICPSISTEEAASALATLFDLGFLKHADKGSIEKRELRSRTSGQGRQAGLHHYHRTTLPELLRHSAMEDNSTQHRLATILVLDEELLPEAKAMLNIVWEKLATMADEHPPGDGARVYQFAVQLLPVTNRLS